LKLLQETVVNTVEHIGIGNNFLNTTPMAQQLRERMNKWDCIEVKCFCTAKETVTRLKRQCMEWKKIFASYSSDKGLITRMYRELKKLNSPRINNPMKKWAHELNRHFSKEVVQKVNKYMKKCSTSLAIKEMQIKVILRFPLIPIRTNVGKDAANRKLYTLLVGM
jgi:hypothetical protein